jgi:hypothetical protein
LQLAGPRQTPHSLMVPGMGRTMQPVLLTHWA